MAAPTSTSCGPPPWLGCPRKHLCLQAAPGQPISGPAAAATGQISLGTQHWQLAMHRHRVPALHFLQHRALLLQPCTLGQGCPRGCCSRCHGEGRAPHTQQHLSAACPAYLVSSCSVAAGPTLAMHTKHSWVTLWCRTQQRQGYSGLMNPGLHCRFTPNVSYCSWFGVVSCSRASLGAECRSYCTSIHRPLNCCRRVASRLAARS